jgi:hypothetical protein
MRVEKTTQQGALCSVLFTKYFSCDQVENEMGRACCYFGRGNTHTGFWWENLREGDHLDGPGINWMIILKWIFDKWNEDMDWIDVA